MKKLIPILSTLLVAQIALAFGLNYAEKTKRTDTGKKILSANLSSIDQIVLEKNEHKLTLQKVGKTWTLPQVYNFPATAESVARLLDKLGGLNGSWPVASTEDAAPRFKVATNDFAERIVLKSANKDVSTVLIGSSAGYNKVHLRADKTNEIFAVELPDREISTESADWIDRSAVELPSDDIDVVELPQLKLTRKKQDFDLAFGGKVVSIDATSASDILENVAGIDISDVLGTQKKSEYGLDAPFFTFKVGLKNGTKLEYKFGKLNGTNFCVLEKPSGDFYLKIDSWFVDRLRNLSAEAVAQKAVQLQKLRDTAAKQLIDKTKLPGGLKEPAPETK